tara:strand:+ start:950 stop:1198 length:249 start_codon:yes stop_codon:yes gene_type:complete
MGFDFNDIENEFLKGKVERNAVRFGTAFRNERYEICKSCDKAILGKNICSVCKCFLPLKTSLPLTECPLGKWGKIDTKNINT